MITVKAAIFPRLLRYLSAASQASVTAAYPSATYTRLASIKAIYDPDNVFNQNQNVKPDTITQF
ncbi:MAG: BBE domain-containing protein [Ktedonobacteraceae bacterium]|nr:BBE domain-containing protein [Ktedonobacteraceae bacterium]